MVKRSRRMRLSDLKAAAYNPREISAQALDGLKASLRAFGDISCVVFNTRTQRLVAGHQRVRALREEHGDLVLRDGAIELPDGERVHVRLVDWDEATERAANVAANSALIQGTFTDAVDALIAQIQQDTPDLASQVRIDDLLADIGAPPDPDEPPELPVGVDDVPEIDEPRVNAGELWRVGEHRVLCGDATIDDDVDRLLAGKRSACVLTDPPYAIYGSATGISSDIADDKMVRPFFERLLRQCHRVLPTFGHAYIHTDWRSWAALWEGARRSGMSPKNCLVWDKGSQGLGSSYAQCYELVGFFAKLPPQKAMTSRQARGQRMVHRPNVLRFNRPAGEERQHNAAKPVELLRELIRNSSDAGDAVLDLFCGSGSTLVAAHAEGPRWPRHRYRATLVRRGTRAPRADHGLRRGMYRGRRWTRMSGASCSTCTR